MRIIDIPNESLIYNQKAYNPAIIQVGLSTWMYYRFEYPGGTHNSDIAGCELDENFQPFPKTNKILRLARWSSKVTTIDDPRAIMWKNRPAIFYSQGNVVPQPGGHWVWACSIAMAHMHTLDVIRHQYLPRYGNNVNCSSESNGSNSMKIATEKNWTPFIHKDKLLMIYTINPLVVLEYHPELDRVVEIQNSPKANLNFWNHGNFLGGGTPLLKHGDEYVGFFHSFTDDHPNKPNVRTYHMGFYAISAEAPFRITRMSSSPLMTAMPDQKHDLRGKSAGWRPNCIYPCGWLERDGKVYVSYGWQDCRCKIAEYTWDEILADVFVLEDEVIAK